MNRVQLFDVLTHPTIDSDWSSPKFKGKADIKQLISQMDENNILKALAVGMKNIGNYDERAYIEFLSPYSEKLVPIAFFDINGKLNIKEVKNQLTQIKKLGYAGIKLHPRISDFDLNHKLLLPIIKYANELEICVLLCSYYYIKPHSLYDNSEAYATLFYKLDNAKIILLHGGTIKLLEMIELVRTYKNILLDLSFTLCKYKGSSIDQDILYAFNTFDERICVGSDFPEFSMKDLRSRFDLFSEGITAVKAENIGFRNINNFLNLK
jgi:predicted TIM-barrel fold metal-dependent hydrolase